MLDLAQLHGELNELEDQVKVGMSWIHKKNAVYESIKKQIIELENSLKDYENNIKISNDKLRNLANKIAEI